MPTATDLSRVVDVFSALFHRSREPWMEDLLGWRPLLPLFSGKFLLLWGCGCRFGTSLSFSDALERVLRLLSGFDCGDETAAFGDVAVF